MKPKVITVCCIWDYHLPSPVLVALGLHVVDDLLPGAGHDKAGQVCLHADHLDVDLVPGDGLEDLILRPLDVEDEPVNCGVTQSQEESVERNTLESCAGLSFLLQTGERRLSLSVRTGRDKPSLFLPWTEPLQS